MTELSHTGASPFLYLRRLHMPATARRTKTQAVLHGLPPFLLLSLNVWMVGLGLVAFIAAYFSLPLPVSATMAAVMAIPCALLSWGLFIRCVEVEAELDM